MAKLQAPRRRRKPFKGCFGEIVDLDDPKVCGKKWEKAAWGTVYCECINQLGFALVYFKYLHPEIDWGDQPKRVEALCKELYDSSHLNMENGAAGRNPDVQYWKGFLYRIWDETENLC